MLQQTDSRGRRRIYLAAAFLSAFTVSPALFAQAGPTTGALPVAPNPQAESLNQDVLAKDPWQFGFFLLGWGPSISGDVTIHGTRADLDVDLSTLVRHLRGAVELGFELRQENFGFYFQPNWISLQADINQGDLSGKDQLDLWLVGAGGFYQLGKWGHEQPVTLDVLAGLRYWHLENELSLRDATGTTVFSGSKTWNLIDPLVGLQSTIGLQKGLNLMLRADLGGFGISNSSPDCSWQVLGMLNYDYSQQVSLSLGYRALSVEKHSGSGSLEHGVDLNFHGPILGFEYQW